jgi:hypothetical protein
MSTTKRSKTFNFTYLADKFNCAESEIREALSERYGEDANTMKSVTTSDIEFLEKVFASQESEKKTETTESEDNQNSQDNPKALTAGEPETTSQAITDTKANTQALRSIPIEMANNLEILALKDETVARLLDTADFIEATEDEFWQKYWEFRGKASVNRSQAARQAIEARRMQKAKVTSQALGESVRKSTETRKEAQTVSADFHNSLMDAYFQ